MRKTNWRLLMLTAAFLGTVIIFIAAPAVQANAADCSNPCSPSPYYQGTTWQGQEPKQGSEDFSETTCPELHLEIGFSFQGLAAWTVCSQYYVSETYLHICSGSPTDPFSIAAGPSLAYIQGQTEQEAWGFSGRIGATLDPIGLQVGGGYWGFTDLDFREAEVLLSWHWSCGFDGWCYLGGRWTSLWSPSLKWSEGLGVFLGVSAEFCNWGFGLKAGEMGWIQQCCFQYFPWFQVELHFRI